MMAPACRINLMELHGNASGALLTFDHAPEPDQRGKSGSNVKRDLTLIIPRTLQSVNLGRLS